TSTTRCGIRRSSPESNRARSAARGSVTSRSRTPMPARTRTPTARSIRRSAPSTRSPVSPLHLGADAEERVAPLLRQIAEDRQVDGLFALSALTAVHGQQIGSLENAQSFDVERQLL